MRIAILGAGNVGGALGKAWAQKGHSITYGVPDPTEAKYRPTAEAAGNARLASVADAARNADVLVLAVPFPAVDAALAAAGNLSGRLVIDVTNPLRMGTAGLELALGFDRSGAEHVAACAPGAAVFKTLNQVGYEVMANVAGYAAPPVMFVAGDDSARKPTVMNLVSDLGFNAVDAGPLTAARLLEPLAMLWIHMAINRNAARDNAFAYLPRNSSEPEQNRRLVLGHFEDFVNSKDLDAIDRNVSPDFLDHDGPGGKEVDRATDRAMMAAMQKRIPDLKVEIRDALAEADKVVVRNVWTGTNSETGERIEFHGFVFWRIAEGRIVERWATVTSPRPLAGTRLDW